MPDAAPITGKQPAGTTAIAAAVTPAAAPTDFLTQLPEDLRADPVFASFKESGLAGLAKSYASAARMVGGDKLALPGKDAAPEAWNPVWDKLGRPKTAAEYQFPVPAKESTFQHDPALVADFRGVAHKIGLSNKQVAEIMGWYNGSGEKAFAAVSADAVKFQTDSVASLKQEWGNAYDAKVGLAKRALKDFGGVDVTKVLDETGLGNHPAIVKMFADLGKAMLEDTLPGSNEQNFGHTPGTAKDAIGALRLNKEFMTAYQDGDHPGHREAVAKMTNLFKDAHPEPKKA
jgi:hypothetical protein